VKRRLPIFPVYPPRLHGNISPERLNRSFALGISPHQKPPHVPISFAFFFLYHSPFSPPSSSSFLSSLSSVMWLGAGLFLFRAHKKRVYNRALRSLPPPTLLCFRVFPAGSLTCFFSIYHGKLFNKYQPSLQGTRPYLIYTKPTKFSLLLSFFHTFPNDMSHPPERQLSHKDSASWSQITRILGSFWAPDLLIYSFLSFGPLVQFPLKADLCSLSLLFQ